MTWYVKKDHERKEKALYFCTFCTFNDMVCCPRSPASFLFYTKTCKSGYDPAWKEIKEKVKTCASVVSEMDCNFLDLVSLRFALCNQSFLYPSFVALISYHFLNKLLASWPRSDILPTMLEYSLYSWVQLYWLSNFKRTQKCLDILCLFVPLVCIRNLWYAKHCLMSTTWDHIINFQNSSVEALNTQYGGILWRGLSEMIRLKWGQKDRVLMMKFVFLQEDTRELSLSLRAIWGCNKKSQEEHLHQNLIMLVPWSWTSQPPELWEISIFCLSHPSYGILL